MILMLKSVSTQRIYVDLLILVRFRTVSCSSDSKLSRMKSLWIRRFTTVENRCKSQNLCCFGKKLGFHHFRMKKLRILLIHIGLVFITVYEWKEVSFFDCYLILFGDLIRIFGILRFDAVSIDSWLEFWNETGDFLLLLLNRFGFLEFFFPSSSQSPSVIGAGVSRVWWGIRTLNCRGINSVMKIHPWISENWWICWWIFGSGKIRVYAFVLCSWWISVLILTAKREKMDSVCCWCGAWSENSDTWSLI